MTKLARQLPLHLRTRPETGVLPRGWLADLRRRYEEEGKDGFVAIDRELTADWSAPTVLGWGRDRSEAARRSGKDPSALHVHPCTAALREACSARPTRCFVFDDVAYTETEPNPDSAMQDWLDLGAYAAHGRAGGDIGEWDEMITLITEIAHAYLQGHPSVEISEDGRFGWTAAAVVRGEVGDDGIAPLPPDVARANAEIEANLRRRDPPG